MKPQIFISNPTAEHPVTFTATLDNLTLTGKTWKTPKGFWRVLLQLSHADGEKKILSTGHTPIVAEGPEKAFATILDQVFPEHIKFGPKTLKY